VTDAHSPQKTTIDAIAEAYVDAVVAIDPYEATYVGIAGHDAEITDLSPDGFAERAALARQTLAQLETATARDERERVAGDAMRERLGLQLEMHEAGLDRSLNNITSPMHWVREVFDLMPTATDEHWANIETRLRAVPEALGAYRQTLQSDIASGLPPASRQVTEVVAQAKRAADGFFSALVEPAPDAIRTSLDDAAGIAASAFADFADHLATEIAPKSRSHDPVGRDVYRVASRYFLGAEVDLDETYAWGLDELNRIESEMAKVAAQISGGGNVDDAIKVLDADPTRTVADVDAFRVWMQQLSDRTIASLTDKHFHIPEPIRTLECKIAPTNDGVMYYTGPSEDFSRPGRMWWSVPEGIEKLTTWRETTTVFHEGVPGHHLQVAQAVHQREVLNRWQRTMCWCSGHGEGWALYAERLMDELGYLDDPGDRLGFLDAQALRAARVLLDLGLHLELDVPDELVRRDGLPAGRWTPAAAWDFMRKHIRQDEKILEFELNRYLGWPGQAPSYKIGERIWLEAREDARRRKAGAFDLKEFHRAALDLGALGLDPLKAALARL
jgi:uncharacterized protein (DUF885 family)